MIFKNTPLETIPEVTNIGATGRLLMYDKANNRLVSVTAEGVGQFVDLSGINTQIEGIQTTITDWEGRIVVLEGLDYEALSDAVEGLQTSFGTVSGQYSTLIGTTIPDLQENLSTQIGTINDLLGDTDLGTDELNEPYTLTQLSAMFKLDIEGFETKFTNIEADLDPNNEGGLIHTLNYQYSQFTQSAEGFDTRVGALEAEFVDGGEVFEAVALLGITSEQVTANVSRLEYTNLAVGTIDVYSNNVITDNDGNFNQLGIRKGMSIMFTSGEASGELRTITAVSSNTVTMAPGDSGEFTAPSVGDSYAIGDAGRLASSLFKVQAGMIESRVTDSDFSMWQTNTYQAKIEEIEQLIQTANDGTLVTFFQATEPATGNEGDLWFDTDDANKLYRFDSTISNPGDPLVDQVPVGWVPADDDRIATLINDVATAQSTADGKIQTWFSDTEPADSPANDLGVGDLWFDTSPTGNNIVYYWDGAQWLDLDDPRFAQLNQEMNDLQSAIGTKITSYYQSDPPVEQPGADPPVLFTEGDIWVDTDNGQIFRWDPNEGVSGGWVDGADSRVGQAVTQANLAKDVADGKAQAFFQDTKPVENPQATPPLTFQTGDLWFDTDDGFKLHRWDPSAGTGGDWVDASDNRIATALSRLDDVEALADGKIQVYYNTVEPVENPQATPPEVFDEGDLWVNTDSGKIHRWNDTTSIWVYIENSDLADAVTNASLALDRVDGKITTYVGTNEPAGTVEFPLVIGDLWLDTTILNPSDPPEDQIPRNLLHRWDGTNWVPVGDGKVLINESKIQQNSTSITSIVERMEFTTVITSVITGYDDTTKRLTDTTKDFSELGIEIGHLVEFKDGLAKGTIRAVVAVGTDYLTLQDVGGADPEIGDQYSVGNLATLASTVIKQTADEISSVATVAGDANTRSTQNADKIELQAEAFGMTVRVTGTITSYNDSLGRVTDSGHQFVQKGIVRGMMIRFTNGPASGVVRVISAVEPDYIDTIDEGGADPVAGNTYEIASPSTIASAMFKIQADAISSVVEDLGTNYSTTQQTAEAITDVVEKVENTTEVTGSMTGYSSASQQVLHTGRDFEALGVFPGMMIEFTNGPAVGTSRVITGVFSGYVATRKVTGQPDPQTGDSYKIGVASVIGSSMFKRTADSVTAFVDKVVNTTVLTGTMTGYSGAGQVLHTGRNFVNLGVVPGMMIRFTSGNALGVARAITYVNDGYVGVQTGLDVPDPTGGDTYEIAHSAMISGSQFKQTADSIATKVGNDEIFSKMTQTADGFEFQADQIKSQNFDGTFDGNGLVNYGTVGFAIDKMGRVGFKSGVIGGLTLQGDTLRKQGTAQSLLEIIGNDKPAFHLVAENGEELWIGGEYSFDAGSGVQKVKADFNPDIADQATSGTLPNISSTNQIVSDDTGVLSTYFTGFQSDWGGKLVRLPFNYNVGGGVARYRDDSGVFIDGYVLVEVTIEIVISGYLDNILYQESITKRIELGTGQLSGRDQGSDSFLFEMPPSWYDGVINYRARTIVDNKALVLLGGTSYAGGSGDASISFNNVVLETLPIKEFVSPLGASWYNETNDKRVTINRDTGEALASQMTVEDPTNGQQVHFVVEGGQLRIKRSNGTIITSWNI